MEARREEEASRHGPRRGAPPFGFATATLTAVRIPLAAADFTWVWGLKARAIARSGDLASVFRVDPSGAWSHPEYPPGWPLLLAGASVARGAFDELDLTLLRPLLLGAACLLAGRMTRAPGPYRVGAAAAVSLLPYFHVGAYAGYAEALLVVLVLAAVAAASTLPAPPALATVAVFLVLASWVKYEGVAAAAVAVAVLFVARRRREALVVLAAVSLFGVLPWEWYRRRHVPDLASGDFARGAFSPTHFVEGLRAVAGAMLPLLPWIAGGVLLVVLAPGVRSKRRALLLGAAGYTAGMACAFGFTRLPTAWHVTASWDRIMLVPIAVLIPVAFEAGAEIAGMGRERGHA